MVADLLTSRMLRPAGLVACVLVSSATLVACGETSYDSNVDSNEIASAEPHQEKLSSLLIDVLGTPAERTAGLRLTHELLQDGIEKCMSDRGYEYRRPGFRDDASQHITSVNVADGWLVEPADDLNVGRQIALEHGATRSASEQADHPTGPLPDGYDEALNQCSNPNTGYEDAYLPESIYRLFGAIRDLEESAVDEDAATLHYRSCMRDAGWDVNSRLDLWTQVSDAYPHADSPMPGQTPSEPWQQAAAMEAEAAAADQDCRMPIYVAGLEQIGPKLDDFIAAHQADLDRINGEWTTIVQRANELAAS